MKKFFTLLLAGFLFQITSPGQLKAQLEIGARAGVNLAQLSFDSDDFSGVPSTKAGASCALLVNIPLNSLLSIQAEPGYTQLGTKYIDDHQFLSNMDMQRYVDRVNLSLKCLELPVLLQLNPKIGKLEAVVSLGPEIRYKLSLRGTSKYEYYENGDLLVEKITEGSEVEEQVLRKMDIALTGGIGIAVPIKKVRFFAETRYHFGLSNLILTNENQPNYDDFDGSTQTRSLSFNVGVLFRISRK